MVIMKRVTERRWRIIREGNTHTYNAERDVYSSVAIAVRTTTAATTPSLHCGPKRLSARDIERLEGGAAVVTFRSSRVGSIFGVVDIRN
jgi:hypothetical protein